MTTRLVLADQTEARFYDVDPIGGAFLCVGTLADAKARHPTTHHVSHSEETPRQHEAIVFARTIVHSLVAAFNAHEFDKLVVIAGPHFIGLLREEMPKALLGHVVAEIVKDLMHESEDEIRVHLPVSVAGARAYLPA
jgi:protein required for attachment to host cells